MRGRHAAALALAAALSASSASPSTTLRAGQSPQQDAREEAYRLNNRGVALLEQFKYDEAAATFRSALARDPSLAIAHLNASIAFLYSSDLDQAEREAAEAATRLPSLPHPHYVRGLAARAQNREADAVGFFQRVLQLDPRDVGANVNLAQIHLQNRREADAIPILRGAVAQEPFNITALYNLGLALARAGQREEGQRTMEQSQALRATGYGTTLTNSYLEQGRYAEAIATTGAEANLVDRAVPAARFTAAVITVAAPASSQGSSAGGLTLLDFDGDGDLDLVRVDRIASLYRNDAGSFTNVTASAGLSGARAAVLEAAGAVAADYDNDGRVDLLVLRQGGHTLYHNEGGGRFSDASAAASLPPYPGLPAAAAFTDVDHDGDVDIAIAGGAANAAPLQLLRNNGNGTFADITRDAKLDVIARALAVVPTDVDNRRDMDLLVVDRAGPLRLMKNLRDGTFRDVAGDTGLQLPGGRDITAVAAADVNKDDFPDFFFGRREGPGTFALSDGRGRFTIATAPAAAVASVAAQFVDYDNDGLLDLLAWSDRPRLFRNLGDGWSDLSATAFPSGSTPALASARLLAIADLDRDGDADIVTGSADGGLALWRNSGDARNRFMRVALRGRVSNRSAAGSKIQMRAGSLSQRIETSSSSPAVAPADVVFGLGQRRGADVLRVLWPSGILQAEVVQAAASQQTIEELNRKPSSCPFLFTWNGERFEFVTDFMGGGEMGYWEAPGVRNHPDPIEYVRIRDDQLRPKDGRYEIRVTNELEETVFADRMQLIAVAHPSDVEIYPNEGMTEPAKPFRLFAARDLRPVAHAADEHGHDVTDRLAADDRRAPDDFALHAIRGYAAEHALTIDLGTATPRTLLLLSGWTDYAFSSDNVAAHQAGLAMAPPALQVKDAAGRWRTALAQIGIPVGRPQTLVVEAGRLLEPGEHVVRIVTNMRIYWDRARVGTDADAATTTRRLDPVTAQLRERGFSAELQPAPRGAPLLYDYARVSAASPWKAMLGRYTREGDVRPLLTRSDDMYAITKPGDEMALSFDAAAAGPLPRGSARTFLLFADGYSKEMDINSASPHDVEPLPFHAMRRYPYSAPEGYPDTAAHRQYRERYNTRVVTRSIPRAEASR